MTGKFAARVSPDIMKIRPYTPGKPIEELKREKGLARVVKLASNENPLGASPLAARALADTAAKLNRYPDGYGFELKEALSELWKVAPEEVALGNGSSEIIEMMVRLFVRPGTRVILASPSFSIYEITTLIQGGEPVNVPLKDHAIDLTAIAEAVDSSTSLVILGNPNNPTGSVFTRAEWEAFLAVVPEDLPILLDEAYAEYVDPGLAFSGAEYVAGGRPIVAARTFSKAYGLAALRIGYALAPAEIIDYFNRLRLPFNANAAAQRAATAALSDGEHLNASIELNRKVRERLERFFAAQGVESIKSEANFVTAKVGQADRLFSLMLDEGVIIRSMTGFGMPEWIRVTVGLSEEIDIFEKAFLKLFPVLGEK